MGTHTRLKGVAEAGESLLSDQLEANLVSFFQWGCLGVGGFFNVSIPTSGVYGGNQHQLRVRNDPYYDEGQVWEGFRQNWVFESGVEYHTQPIHVSGVYVNSTFYPISTTGTYAHKIDYLRGQVLFDSPISPSATVTCNYSYRLYNFTTADADWWREFQVNSMRVDDSHFTQYGSGSWNVLASNRIQLPAVIVEAVPSTKRFGKQLGSLTQVTYQDVNFHVIAEDRSQMKWLHDMLTAQKEKGIIGFNKNDVVEDERFPLDAYGSPSISGLMYPDLINEYAWKELTFANTRSVPSPAKPPLYTCVVVASMEVDMP